MGTLALGISLMLLVYALFLYITFRYLFDKENSRQPFLNDSIKKIKKFVKIIGNHVKLQKQ